MTTDLNSLLQLLQAERRRIILKLLHDLQREQDSDDVIVQVQDLARQVAAIEANLDSATVGTTVQRSSNVGLHHTHLPLLNDYGIIEYDTDTNEVTTPQTQPVVQLLRTIEQTVDETEIQIPHSSTSEH